jgi:hypothetical protein
MRPTNVSELGEQGEYPFFCSWQVQHREVKRCTMCLLGNLAVQKSKDLRPGPHHGL